MKPVFRTSSASTAPRPEEDPERPSLSLGKRCKAGLESGKQPCRDARDLHILALFDHLPLCCDCGIDRLDELGFGEHPMLYQCHQNTFAYDHCRLSFGIEVGLPSPATPIMALHLGALPIG